MPIDLPDVTICSADSVFVELTALALTQSIEQCRFGDAILFSDVPADGPFRNVRIPRLASIADYSAFCLHGMADFIKTPFVLVVQWDGFVVNARAWANAFCKYDYIGAAWYGVFAPGVPLVGNGGFSLRSRKLLNALKKLPVIGGYWEDRLICHVFGPRLEQDAGIRFARAKIADRFAYEYRIPDKTPFGFHGIEHLWRHMDDDELVAAAEKMDFARLDKVKILRLISNCAANGRQRPAVSLYRHIRRSYPPLVIERALSCTLGRATAAAQVAKLERLAS